MTYEGRKFTHELCIKQGRPSPYADEFEKVAEKAPKSVKKGKEKQDE